METFIKTASIKTREIIFCRLNHFNRYLEKHRLATQTDKTKTNNTPAHLDFIKDPYVLEFLQLPDSGQLKESKLEQAIIDELQKFLLEMGKGFSFVARQMRISTETSHFIWIWCSTTTYSNALSLST